ncbi:unnamed protein product [Darwinula stevensoni]|uniref:Kringle domain-containing protein n=1 Tax=Darwinula stevensoni TaxID=69355 RepID=A0A7R9FRX6_9CRUS|nr:unnamed protein product [Darwinula stevensoni]CAG0901807.1 unnamed protein product [Darwinula stevensoni]
MLKPPCHAFNYRESDGSCQLVLNGMSNLTEANGYGAYVQSKQQHTYPECRLTVKGREYIGKMKNSESGKECLRWDIQPYGKPEDFSNEVSYAGHFPNLDVWSQKNYCRNPSGKKRPWCFISDPEIQWEYCEIPMCTDRDHPECKVTQQGSEYIGKQNTTLSGRRCQPWRSLTYEQENFTIDNYLPGFADSDEIDEHFNFCRNPNADAAPLCSYTEENSTIWEYCNVSFCGGRAEKGDDGHVYPECRLSEKGKEYVGRRSETETGKTCLTWGNRPYGTPWDFLNRDGEYAGHFLNLDPSIHENYCRNSGLHRERPWCFVTDPEIEWEYCDIPRCHDQNPPECKLTMQGGEYVGKQNATFSGFPCQHWLTNFPNPHDMIEQRLSAFSDEVDGSHNFCRNPDGLFHGPTECRIQSGTEYMGTKNRTKSGHPCQPWLSHTPHELHEKYYYNPKGRSFPDDLHSSHNFCRNPTSDPAGPWCYNGAGKRPEWEYCDIPRC